MQKHKSKALVNFMLRGLQLRNFFLPQPVVVSGVISSAVCRGNKFDSSWRARMNETCGMVLLPTTNSRYSNV